MLALSSDERLVEQLRQGNEAAFDVMFTRYASAILSFCRHMVGSLEEAEDAAQHTFAAAHHSLLRDDRDMALRPWLYTIARNRCISILRERPDPGPATADGVTSGLAEHVEQRVELRTLLLDIADLPDEQREALLLTEIGGLSHQSAASILGCSPKRVKGLVFRARRNLIVWRDARETPCAEIREQLATLRGTELRRNELRHHLRGCPECRDFQKQVRHERTLAAALPLLQPAGFKASVMAALGLRGGASAGGALASIGATAPVAGSTLAKVALAVLAIGGGTATINQTTGPPADAPAHLATAAVEAAPRAAPQSPFTRAGAGDAGDRLRLVEPPTTQRSTEPGSTAGERGVARGDPPGAGSTTNRSDGRAPDSPQEGNPANGALPTEPNPGEAAIGEDVAPAPAAGNGKHPRPTGNHGDAPSPPREHGEKPVAPDGHGHAHDPPAHGRPPGAGDPPGHSPAGAGDPPGHKGPRPHDEGARLRLDLRLPPLGHLGLEAGR